MLLEALGASLMLSSSVRVKPMKDKKKIEKIFEYTRTWVTSESGDIKKCQYVRKDKIIDDGEQIGVEYVYRLPLGMPYKKLEYLNDNVGVFKDGLHKNVELEFDGGMLHINVYEQDLPRSWDYVPPQCKGWEIPIGRTYKGLITHDFDKTPHMVGGGTTQYGKTNLINSMIASLIITHPDDVDIYLIDLKAGVEFWRHRNLRQVKMVATDVGEAHELLAHVMDNLDDTKKFYRASGWSNFRESKIKKRTFIIIDEAGDLSPEKFMNKQERIIHEECQWMLSHIARIGGAFGFRELFFSQYTTADVLPRQIKQNADAKICFKLQNKYSSEVVLGDGNNQAAELDDIPGRAMYKSGANLTELQVPKMDFQKMVKHLQDYYVTKRRDVTNESHESPDEDTAQFIQIRDHE